MDAFEAEAILINTLSGWSQLSATWNPFFGARAGEDTMAYNEHRDVSCAHNNTLTSLSKLEKSNVTHALGSPEKQSSTRNARERQRRDHITEKARSCAQGPWSARQSTNPNPSPLTIVDQQTRCIERLRLTISLVH